MGENSAKGESILGGYSKNGAVFVENNRPLIAEELLYMHTFDADKLKYVHGKAFGYKQFKFKSTFEAALMVESKGERKNEV